MFLCHRVVEKPKGVRGSIREAFVLDEDMLCPSSSKIGHSQRANMIFVGCHVIHY